MRPFVRINCAMSIDGKISTKLRKQLRISSDEDVRRVDELRAWSDAIMVGIGTVLSDDPSLRVKFHNVPRQPKKVVVDSMARTPPECKLLNSEGEKIIFVSERAPRDRVEKLMKHALVITSGKDRVDLKQALEELWRMGVKKLLVEGGATLNWGLISLGLVDEIFVYVRGFVIGGRDSPTLVDGEGFTEKFPEFELAGIERDSQGILLKWKAR